MKRLTLVLVVLLLLLLVAGGAAYLYKDLMGRTAAKSVELFVPTGTDYDQLKVLLTAHEVIEDQASFDLASRLLRFRKRIVPGKYDIKKGTSILDVCRMFRGGRVSTVKVTFHNTRTLSDVAGKVAPYIEADSSTLVQALTNKDIWKGLNVEGHEACYLIPNTYEFYWNTTGTAFVERMVKESNIFWNEERQLLAHELGLSRCEVVTLASIVQEEQNQQLSEQKRIAGVYINRLKKGIPLQADPTLKFAAGDFSLKRLLNVHKAIESPYNTYLNADLPPGPITIPEPGAIDAVLNYEKHKFIYFCAKEDFSGFHNFARTLSQHNINARKYQNALNREMRRSRQ